MKIKKIVLIGYTRFSLTNTRKVVYTPEKIEQVILGTNGSGKSSILSIIANVLAAGSDFVKGGSCEILVSHRHAQYRLFNKYDSKAGSHEFEVNGVNLNDGGTLAVQKELIMEHFGLTPSIAAVLTKKVKFTTMGQQQRRDWLMLLSRVNFEFVLKMYNEFKENVSDLKGYIRHLTESLDDAAEQIRSLEEGIEGTEEAIQQLRSELDALLRAAGNASNMIHAMHQLETVGAQIKQETRKLLSLGKHPSVEKMEGAKDDLVALRTKLSTVMTTIDERLRSHQEQMEYFDRISHDLGLHRSDSESDSDLSEASLKERIESLSEELTGLLPQVILFKGDRDNAELKMNSAIGIRESLTDVCSRIPVNDNGQFTKTGRGELQAQVKAYEEDLFKLRNRINQLDHVISHAAKVGEVDCPDCGSHFKPGIRPETIERDKKELVERGTQLDKVITLHKEAEAKLETYREYAQVLAEFRAIVGGAPSISSFWNKVICDELQYKAPMRIPSVLERFINEMDIFRQANQAQASIELLSLRLEAVRSAGGTEHIRERVAELEGQFVSLQDQKQRIGLQLGQANETIERLEQIAIAGAKVANLSVEYQEVLDAAVGMVLSKEIEGLIAKHHERIGLLSERWQRYTSTCLQYESKYADKEKAMEQYEASKLVVKALSPNEGVIADAIKRFTTHFTGLLNRHIDEVWTYPMEVVAVVDDAASLNCKFPLKLHTSAAATVVPDVGMGSDGQAEIVDFAFILVVMELLDLKGYPLLIDEFGKTFDSEHRERVIRYIKGLMDDHKYGQMFMVSHYAAIYDTFTQAEYVVTDDRNITVPETYNTNFIME